MDKPHKAHHKPSSGTKAVKKDVARDIDRTGGKNFNPKVSTRFSTQQSRKCGVRNLS